MEEKPKRSYEVLTSFRRQYALYAVGGWFTLLEESRDVEKYPAGTIIKLEAGELEFPTGLCWETIDSRSVFRKGELESLEKKGILKKIN